jgi:hypothetical protein
MSLFNSLAFGLQRTDIHRLDEKAEALEKRLWSERNRSDDLRLEMRELRRDVASVLLAVETIQRVLADRGICGAEDFIKRMRAIDAEDGIVDGRITPNSPQDVEELRYCDGCQHFNPPRLKGCQYCGRLFGGTT